MPTKPKSTKSAVASVDAGNAEKLLLKLLAIPGISGKESAVATAIIKELRAAGVPAGAIADDGANARSPHGGERGNLIVMLPGTLKAPRRLLMAHMDTVPLCAGCKPYRDGEIVRSKAATGLGGDNRSGCAVILNAVQTILRNKLPHPPLTLLFTVQEEVGLAGARALDPKRLGKPKLCFNWDGNQPQKLIVGATGAYRMGIEIEGIPAHAGVAPELGVSAAAIAGLAIAELQREGWHGKVEKRGRTGTSNIGVIHGGEATNVVMDRLTLKAEARSHDSAFRRAIVAAYQAAFNGAARTVRNAGGRMGSVRFNAELHYDSFELKGNEPVLAEASRVLNGMGLEPLSHVSNGGLDANWMYAHGFPTVTFGAGQREIHTAAEHLHLPSFFTACEVALRLATAR